MKLKYIEFNGKHPAAAKENRVYFDAPAPEWIDYGAAYPSGYMKVDIDDRDHKTGELTEPIRGKPRSTVIISILDTLQIHYLGIRTNHGVHLFFRVPEDMERKNKQNWVSALNVTLECKFPESDDHIPLQIGGIKREIFSDPVQLDTLPSFLWPVQKSRLKPFDMTFPDGDRTQKLGGYLFYLVGKGFTAEQAFQAVRLMNAYVFPNPIPEDTLDAQILNESTKEKLTNEQVTRNNKVINLDTFNRFCIQAGLSIRYNELLNIVEYDGIPADWKIRDEQNIAPIKIQDMFKAFTRKNVSKQQVIDFISHEADTHSYNPVRDYLTAAQWDGVTRFPAICAVLGVTDSFEQTLIRKWFYQTAAMAFNEMKAPFQAEGVLILQGAEGIGKSRFFQQIIPDPLWFSSLDKELTTKNKDILIQMLSVWVGEIGEIDRTFRANRSDMKNFITARDDRIRKPYRAEPVTKARTTSFCGTTNKAEFLTDDSGSRRWWVVMVPGKINMTAFLQGDNLQQLWSECYAAFCSDRNCFRLTDKEIRELDSRNRTVTELLPGEEELRTRFNFNAPLENWHWATPSALRLDPAFAADIRLYSAEQLGKAIRAIAKDHPQILLPNGKARRSNSGMLYRLPPGKTNTDAYRNTAEEIAAAEKLVSESLKKFSKN